MKQIREIIASEEILATNVSEETIVTELSFNSTSVPKGGVYFALRGTRVDGHQFVGDVLNRGVAAVVVDRKEIYDKFPQTILVASTRRILALASSRWFDDPTKQFSLVGVTGTNGKTTTCCLLQHIWRRLGLNSGTVGTLGYQMGDRPPERSNLTTPDPLDLQAHFRQMVDLSVSHVALEVSSIALDQERASGSQFQVALFTNLTQDHLDYHRNLEDYFLAKKKLLYEMNVPAGVFNIDDPYGEKLYAKAPIKEKISFSLRKKKADFRVRSWQLEADGMSACLEAPAGQFSLKAPLFGQHNLYNCLGALGVCFVLGQDLKEAVSTLSDCHGAPGRLERVGRSKQRPRVFVDYAHTPDALVNVLSVLNEVKKESGGKLITVFGCGGDRDSSKRPLMGKAASTSSEVTIATSDNPRTEDPQKIIDAIEVGVKRDQTRYMRLSDRREAIYRALEIADSKDVVLVAGKGHEDYQILGKERIFFDDREVIRDYYKDK